MKINGGAGAHAGVEANEVVPHGCDGAIDSRYRDWAKSLTAEERGALREYRNPGVYYIVNYFLRQGKVPPLREGQEAWASHDKIRDLAWNLDSALKKAPVLTKPMTVYRAVAIPDRLMAAANQRCLTGEILDDRGFLSTTTNKATGTGYELNRGSIKVNKVFMEIEVPAGTSCAYIESSLQRDPQYRDRGFTEHEMLFALGDPGHRLRFTSELSDNGQVPLVKATLQPNGAKANWYPAFPHGWSPSSSFEDEA